MKLNKIVRDYCNDLIETEMFRRLKEVRKELIEERKACQELIVKALPDPNIIEGEVELVFPKQKHQGQD